MYYRSVTALLFAATHLLVVFPVHALDGGVLRVNPRNGWSAFEVISRGDDPAGDGFNWSMPDTFDGLGAWLPDASTLRLQVNHETNDATISEVNLDRTHFQLAISNTLSIGHPGGVTFVQSARQAYDRWSDDGGSSWTATSDTTNTSFYRFCSGQSYRDDTFGVDRGFVDDIYIMGEEGGTKRLFALDLVERDFYLLSGVSGSASVALGGMPFDSWENAALVDTGETDHVALLLSPDGGSERMQLYVGEKGKDTSGSPASDFLTRNGLAYGSYFYLNDSLPVSGTSTNGSFDTTTSGALRSSKMEDIDTSPSDPIRVVLGDQNSGLFTFEFDLDFGGGGFNAAGSGFSITKIQDHLNDTDGSFGDADNVDWTDSTILSGNVFSEGLIFVNEDTGTNNGEIWMNTPTGTHLTKIGDTVSISGSTETSGILDISSLVGYAPGSVLLTNNQGSNSSLSALINPDATQLPMSCDFDFDGACDEADMKLMYSANGHDLVNGVASSPDTEKFDLVDDNVINNLDIDAWLSHAAMKNGYATAYRRGDTDDLGNLVSRDVDLTDFNHLSSNFSPGGTGLFWPQGNFDGDGDVDLADYNYLAGNFYPGGYGAPVHEVPEPTSLILGMLSLVCTMWWLATLWRVAG